MKKSRKILAIMVAGLLVLPTLALGAGDEATSIRNFRKVVTASKSYKLFVHQRALINFRSVPSGGNFSEFNFESSDSSVVAVSSDGIVRGVQPGNAEVTIRAIKGKGIAKCSFIVCDLLPNMSTYDINDKQILCLLPYIQRPQVNGAYIGKYNEAGEWETPNFSQEIEIDKLLLAVRDKGLTGEHVDLPNTEYDRISLFCSALSIAAKYSGNGKLEFVATDPVLQDNKKLNLSSKGLDFINVWLRINNNIDVGRWDDLVSDADSKKYRNPDDYYNGKIYGDRINGARLNIIGCYKISDGYYAIVVDLFYGGLRGSSSIYGLKRYGETWRLTAIVPWGMS